MTWRFPLRRKASRSSAPTTATGERSAERLIAHELAHQWFGNSVTARRWRDIWLHEGFACYAEWLWSEDSGRPHRRRARQHYHHKLAYSPQDLLLADPGPRDMFDDRVYKRGALTLHVLRRTIGDDDFFALLRDWTARHRHGTAVTDDFTGLAANYADESLRPLWQAWLYSDGRPRPVTDGASTRPGARARSPGAASPGSAWRPYSARSAATRCSTSRRVTWSRRDSPYSPCSGAPSGCSPGPPIGLASGVHPRGAPGSRRRRPSVTGRGSIRMRVAVLVGVPPPR